MKDETLLKLSLVTSIVGLLLLFSIAQMAEVPAVTISQITEDYIGRTVLISGNISSVFTSNKGTIFLEISDKTGVFKAVIFKNLVSKVSPSSMQKGQQVQIQGKINEYEGELEIIPDKITVIE